MKDRLGVLMKDRLGVLALRPWKASFGDRGQPATLLGIEVIATLRRRQDKPAVLALLEDRRVALTGPVLAVGHPRVMALYLRGRAVAARTAEDQQWLMSCSRELRAPRRASGPAGRQPS